MPVMDSVRACEFGDLTLRVCYKKNGDRSVEFLDRFLQHSIRIRYEEFVKLLGWANHVVELDKKEAMK